MIKVLGFTPLSSVTQAIAAVNSFVPRPVTLRRALRGGLAAAFLLALALRLVGLAFGADTVLTPRSDEEILRLAVLHSLAGDLDPHYAVWGHLFHDLYLALGALDLAAALVLGRAPTWIAALARAHCRPTELIVLGRSISALAGSLTLLPTYWVARRLFRSRLIGLGGAIILATAFLHVRDSHFATTDVLATCAGTWALAAMVRRGATVEPGHAAWAGAATGIALAAKLSTAPLVPTFATLVLLEQARRRRVARCLVPAGQPAEGPGRITEALKYLARYTATIGAFAAAAVVVAVLLQPFMLLDPVQTLYGVFGDIFNPLRRPLVGGFDYHVPAVMLRYFVPQALGWVVGGLAIAGGVMVAVAPRGRRERWVLVFLFWTIVPLITVRLTYLRYMDPLLPMASVLAAVAIERGSRLIAGRLRGWAAVGLMLLACVPNGYRDVLLDQRLCRADTRARAKHWIESKIPSGSRIVWVGFGSYAPYLSMPLLDTTERYDRAVIERRRRHGLSTRVERAILAWKRRHGGPTYDAVVVSPAGFQPEVPGYVRFPLGPPASTVPLAQRIDRWGRRIGLLNDEEVYYELLRRHLAGWAGLDRHHLSQLDEPWLIVTRLPPHRDLLGAVGPQYELVQTIAPGWHGRPADERDMLYDWNDAWWLPNIGIQRVERPGPEIDIFRLREPPSIPAAGTRTDHAIEPGGVAGRGGAGDRGGRGVPARPARPVRVQGRPADVD